MFPRKIPHVVGSAWEIDAPAKLNLYLEVLGRPTEGFHPLETLMVPVRIFDQLHWIGDGSRHTVSRHSKTVQRDECSLRISNFLPADDSSCEPLTSGPENLILRAANRLAQAAGVKPHGTFELVKRIPMQAGLGGGSSDAAAALLLANEGWQLGYTRQQLMEVAAEIGSDVPYFLGTGAAVCRGRGEIIEPVAGLPRLHFVVITPPVGLSTAEVFSHLRLDNKPRHTSTELPLLLDSLRQGAISRASQWMTNRLEQAACQLTPWIDRLHKAMTKCGCHAQLMTGSGSSYIGIMRSAKQARRVARQLAGMKLGNVFATASC